MLDANPREKIRRWAVVFLLMQGIGGLIWWLGILSVSSWHILAAMLFAFFGSPRGAMLVAAPPALRTVPGGLFIGK